MTSTADVRRLEFGWFVRPAEETASGRPGVEACLGYAVAHVEGLIVFDTGMGGAGDDAIEAHYRPRRRPLSEALNDIGATLGDVCFVVNCHLHFDHCGGNPQLAGRPVFTQAAELAAARGPDHTLAHLIDFEGVRYEVVEGEAEILPDIWVIPTPGHTAGHQSLAVRCVDGTVILAGQSHDTASDYGADQLAWRATREGAEPLLPPFPAWIDRLQQMDPRRVLFAHDLAVWEPA